MLHIETGRASLSHPSHSASKRHTGTHRPGDTNARLNARPGPVVALAAHGLCGAAMVLLVGRNSIPTTDMRGTYASLIHSFCFVNLHRRICLSSSDD